MFLSARNETARPSFYKDDKDLNIFKFRPTKFYTRNLKENIT